VAPATNRVTMRVLHVMPDLTRAYGGPVEALAGFVAAVSGEATVTVVGPRAPAVEVAWLRAQLSATTVQTASRFGVPALASRLAADADVVHVHGLLNTVSSRSARVLIARGRPVVIGPFGTMSRYTFTHRRRLAKRLYFALIDGPNLRRASAIHFTTAAERDEAAWHGLDLAARSYVVPPPWRGGRSPARAVTESETVLFLSRIHPVKGLDVLLRAWPLVRARRPAARLVVAGAGEASYVAAMRALAPDDAAHGVHFTGFVSGAAKAACLAEAAIFVLPSLHENFGIAVLEAVAGGVPAVVSPGVQLAPWVESRGVGRVVEREPAALAEAIVSAIGDAELRRRVARCGSEMVWDEFAPARIAPALLAMYRGAIKRG
jgi:glycosyltransferase involved in cell wall biosynthesis